MRIFLMTLVGLLLGSGCRNLEAAPRSMPHPDDRSRQVEYFVEMPVGRGPWPTVVFLHGHQDGSRPGGKDFADWGVLGQFARRGYLAVSVSQPGYGNSSGPPDFCGEFTQHAVTGVIARLRADGWAAPGKILIEGISRGAVVASLIAARDPSVAGLVLVSGVYDLAGFAADPHAPPPRQAVVQALLAETGGSPEALQVRSVLRFARSIKAVTLIMNGAKDVLTDARQATRLAEEIVRAGGNARAIIYPDFGHQIPVEVRDEEIIPFIERVLARPGPF